MVMTWPTKSPESTAAGAGRFAVAVHAASKRWLLSALLLSRVL